MKTRHWRMLIGSYRQGALRDSSPGGQRAVSPGEGCCEDIGETLPEVPVSGCLTMKAFCPPDCFMVGSHLHPDHFLNLSDFWTPLTVIIVPIRISIFAKSSKEISAFIGEGTICLAQIFFFMQGAAAGCTAFCVSQAADLVFISLLQGFLK